MSILTQARKLRMELRLMYTPNNSDISCHTSHVSFGTKYILRGHGFSSASETEASGRGLEQNKHQRAIPKIEVEGQNEGSGSKKETRMACGVVGMRFHNCFLGLQPWVWLGHF